MPMGEYSNFADCVSKNKSKDNPDAYCGYIKHQIEGGKKKEEVEASAEHEAYHLEEEVKRMEEAYGGSESSCPNCGASTVPSSPEDSGPGGYNTCQNCGKLYKKEETLGKTHLHQPRPETRAKHIAEKLGYSAKEFPEIIGTPEPEIEQAALEFVNTLRATLDEVTLMAKDTGYMGVSEKTSPTKPTYMYEVTQEMADVVLKQAKGFNVEVNWFNTTIDELQDIVKGANKFFTDAGWNSKQVVKEYEAHKKKWGKDWM